MFRPGLPNGGTIAIVAPSTAQDQEKLRQGIAWLHDKGYHTVVAPSCTSHDFLKLSGPDEQRAKDINEMFARDDIDAIICMAGGYGTPRIVDALDYDTIRNHPKVFSGFSDVTLLLNAIADRCGFQTFHGPMIVGDFSRGDNPHLASFFELVRGEELRLPMDGVTVLRPGTARGDLFGGNLSLLQVYVSMKTTFDPTNRILLIEDVHEANYRIDRMLQSLRLHGLFDGIAGVIIGGVTSKTTPQPGALEVFRRFFADAPYPVLFNVPIGHVVPRYAVPIGGTVSMATNPPALIALKEPTR